MTVYDLEDLELSYAPPYGSAKDPVNYAGFVAANVLRGDVKLCHAEDVLDPRDDQVLLDVRTPAEVAGRHDPRRGQHPAGRAARAAGRAAAATRSCWSSARSACAATSPAAS